MCPMGIDASKSAFGLQAAGVVHCVGADIKGLMVSNHVMLLLEA